MGKPGPRSPCYRESAFGKLKFASLPIPGERGVHEGRGGHGPPLLNGVPLIFPTPIPKEPKQVLDTDSHHSVASE